MNFETGENIKQETIVFSQTIMTHKHIHMLSYVVSKIRDLLFCDDTVKILYLKSWPDVRKFLQRFESEVGLRY